MDRTVVNIVSLILGGAGVFAALAEYDVPELRQSYWGSNPFRLKADIIGAVLSVVFGSLAVAAILLQVVAEAVGDALPSRLHGMGFYLWLALGTVLGAFVVIASLARLGRALARRKWLPEVISSQRDLYESAREIDTNGGLRANQIGLTNTLPPLEQIRSTNLSAALQQVEQIERLLDIKVTDGTLTERLERLAPHFEAQSPVV